MNKRATKAYFERVGKLTRSGKPEKKSYIFDLLLVFSWGFTVIIISMAITSGIFGHFLDSLVKTLFSSGLSPLEVLISAVPVMLLCWLPVLAVTLSILDFFILFSKALKKYVKQTK